MGTLRVTGASGLLGSKICSLAPQALGWHFSKPTGKSVSMDATDADAVNAFFACSNIFACIHCAADSDLKHCENDPFQARRKTVRMLAIEMARV